MSLTKTSVALYDSGNGGGSGYGTGSYTTASFTPANNSRLVVFVTGISNGNTSIAGNLTLTSSVGYTLTRSDIGESLTNGDEFAAVYTAPVTTGSAGTLTVDSGSDNIYRYLLHVYYEVDSGGSIPTVGAHGSYGNTTGGSPQAFNLSGTTATSSRIGTAGVADGGSGTVTIPSGWTAEQTYAGGDFFDKSATVTGVAQSTVTFVALNQAGGQGVAAVAVEIQVPAGGGGTPFTSDEMPGTRAVVRARMDATQASNFTLMQAASLIVGEAAIDVPNRRKPFQPDVLLDSPPLPLVFAAPVGDVSLPEKPRGKVSIPFDIALHGPSLPAIFASPVGDISIDPSPRVRPRAQDQQVINTLVLSGTVTAAPFTPYDFGNPRIRVAFRFALEAQNILETTLAPIQVIPPGEQVYENPTRRSTRISDHAQTGPSIPSIYAAPVGSAAIPKRALPGPKRNPADQQTRPLTLYGTPSPSLPPGASECPAFVRRIPPNRAAYEMMYSKLTIQPVIQRFSAVSLIPF